MHLITWGKLIEPKKSLGAYRKALEHKNKSNVTTDKAKRSNCLAWFLDFSIQNKATDNAFDFIQRNLEYNHQL